MFVVTVLLKRGRSLGFLASLGATGGRWLCVIATAWTRALDLHPAPTSETLAGALHLSVTEIPKY